MQRERRIGLELTGARPDVMTRRRRIGPSIAALLPALLAVFARISSPEPGIHSAALGPTGEPLAHDWRLRAGRDWQIAPDAVESVEVTDAAERTTGSCPAGMVEIDGAMKTDGSRDVDALDLLQKTACTEWVGPDFPERCMRYDRSRWIDLSRSLPTERLRFCIDRFEYPNRRGAYPWIVVTWLEASALCADDGKRLCNEAEWTFACEGEEAFPYPYGYERDPTACVIDRPWLPVHEAALAGRTDARAIAEIDRLWQGEASGARPRCRSPFGVFDMTGNVDEWTTSVRSDDRPSVFKGGYWGPVRTRCRGSPRAHGEDYAFYQQGFRCCANLP